jgi:hypothetical protein
MATCDAAWALSPKSWACATIGSEPKVLGLCHNFLCTRTHPQACLRARQVLAVDLDRTITDAWAWNKTGNLKNPSSLSPLPFVIHATVAGGWGRIWFSRGAWLQEKRLRRGPLRRSMYVQDRWSSRSLFHCNFLFGQQISIFIVQFFCIFFYSLTSRSAANGLFLGDCNIIVWAFMLNIDTKLAGPVVFMGLKSGSAEGCCNSFGHAPCLMPRCTHATMSTSTWPSWTPARTLEKKTPPSVMFRLSPPGCAAPLPTLPCPRLTY